MCWLCDYLGIDDAPAAPAFPGDSRDAVNRESSTPRLAPNATKYMKGSPPDEVPVYTFAGSGEAEWRAYVGPRDPSDTGE